MTSHNPDRRRIFLAAVQRGASKTAAAAAAGVSRTTPYDWERDDPAFAEQIRDAEGQSMLRRLARIEKAAEGGEWRADVWLLSVQFPEHFSTKRVEVTGKDGGPIEVDARARLLDAAKQLTDAELGIDDGANK